MFQSSSGILKLSKSELKLLDYVSQHKQIDLFELRFSLGLSSARVSQLASSLREKKLLDNNRLGKKKVVTLADSKHALLYAELRHEFEHMNLPSLLSGTNLEVISAVSYLHLKSRAEIQSKCLTSEASIGKTLLKLKGRGVILRETTYTISPRFNKLREFVREFRHYLNLRIAASLSERAHIIYEANHEFIVECDVQNKCQGFTPTGISVFGKYGAPFLLSKSYLIYSPFKHDLTLEDAILHSLLIGDNPLPTLVTWWKNRDRLDLTYLCMVGRQYGVEGRIDELVDYFDTGGLSRKPPLPPWNEFMDKYRGYETE